MSFISEVTDLLGLLKKLGRKTLLILTSSLLIVFFLLCIYGVYKYPLIKSQISKIDRIDTLLVKYDNLNRKINDILQQLALMNANQREIVSQIPNNSGLLNRIENNEKLLHDLKEYTNAIIKINSFIVDTEIDYNCLTYDQDSTNILVHGHIGDTIFKKDQFRSDEFLKDTMLILLGDGEKFNLPIYGKLFRDFNNTHKGIDILLHQGDSIKSCFDGVVRYSKYTKGGYGNLIVIRNYNGLETYYSLLPKMIVKENQIVHSGEVIGVVDSTKSYHQPFLHFEIRYRDYPIDPLKMIDYDNLKLFASTYQLKIENPYRETPNKNVAYYKIKSGDTFEKIAKRYNTSIKELCVINNMKLNSPLRVGEYIRVK